LATAVRRSVPAADGGGSSAFLLGGAAATALYAVDVAPVASLAAFLAVGFGAVVALLTGPRRYGVQLQAPWRLLAAACVTFLAGALLRPWASEQAGAAVLLADLFTVPGYLLLFLGLGGLLRVRGIERHAVTDGLIVCVGAAIISALLLAVPAASIENRPAVVSLLAGMYPLFDAVLVLLLVSLAFTTAVRQPSYVMLVAMMGLMLVGDLAYAVIGVSGQLAGHPLLDLPFLLGYTLIGGAALHPSIADLGQARPLPVQAWSCRRLLLIGPALAVPFVLTTVVEERTLTARLILGLGGAAMVALLLGRAVSAVQDYAAAQLRFEHQATHDPLTGLPNRLMLATGLNRLLAAAPDGGPPVWVLFLDLDGFKLVNDSWGHEAGDQLIVEMARRLRAAVPGQDSVARVGGDEFVVVHRGSREQAVELVEHAVKCVAEPLQVRGVEVVITASVGIAGTPVVPGTGVTAEALMRDADTAMYQAKAEGCGKWVVFDASMHERVRERMDIELALRHALGHAELRLAYQPIVELATGRLLGAEALIRWEHPTRGSVPPNAFIPVAEDTGLVSAIGRWVLDEALAQLAAWRADGTVAPGFWVSVNVSPRQLRDPGLPAVVAEAMLRYDLPPTALVLEITESVMVDGSAVTDQVMRDLRALGVRIVVDDFGTGFSALGYLRRHPVTGVKIDRGFVGGLGAGGEDEEIVRAVVAMSSALGLTVVAEGVETLAQQDVLAGLGVVLGQGWLWGTAVCPDGFSQRWAALPGAGGPQVAAGNS
jgi:diguanylate cyclase